MVRVSHAREEEGTRIAREIHDELGSALTSLRWGLESVSKTSATSKNQIQPSLFQEKIDEMMNQIDSIINVVRRIASELRPSILDDLGLVEAIEWQAQQFQERTEIVCQCNCLTADIELNQAQSTAVFRVFQEALTNILRHAQATKVEITTEKNEGNFILTIRDNGIGITKSANSGLKSLGILGMRERVSLVGGKIEINGVKGKGTMLIVQIPISD
ncbi:MAG TPA: sensor histidine kinase [Pyrinomonadaceae bacterium]|nr:sensor histidine kinase [Pyrinomonadaceae bacterium]